MLPSNPTPTVRQLEVFERHHIALIDMHEMSQGKDSPSTRSTGSPGLCPGQAGRASSGQAGSWQKLEVRNQKSEARSKADL